MYIKSVTIKSFLSYEKFTMDQMSLGKGVNMVLGNNGSGKSSFLQGKFVSHISEIFYAAIIFCLSDSHSTKTK